MKTKTTFITIFIILFSIMLYGCNNTDTTIINIKGIEIVKIRTISKNNYPIKFLSINALDLQTNETFLIHEEENPDYIITLPKSPMNEAFFNANKNPILKINGKKFRLIVNLTITYNNNDIYLNANENIIIEKTDDNLHLKNEKYINTIIGHLIEFEFKLENNEKEILMLHFNYEEIKNN